MQGTLPVRVARSPRRRWSRRRYVVAGLALVLLFALLSIAALVLLRPFDLAVRKPSPDIVKLAESFRYGDTLSSVFGPLAWSPDGRYLATSSQGRLLIREVSAGNGEPRQRGIPYTLTSGLGNVNVGGMVIPGAISWSPDSGLLAVDEPGGLVPHTITLVEAEEARVRLAIRVPAPPELPGKSSGGIEPSQRSGMHGLLGWADGGRSLVSLLGIVPDAYPGATGFPYPVATAAPGSAGAGPPPTPLTNPIASNATSIYCYVLDTETGNMVRSVQIYSSMVLPRIYSLALSPSGEALAFAWFETGLPNSYPGATAPLKLDVWDLRNSRLLYSVPGLGVDVGYSYAEGPDQYLAWSPDGATLYVGSEDTVKVIEAATGKVLRGVPGVVPPTYTPAPPPTMPPTQIGGPGMPLVPMPVSTAGLGPPGGPLVPLPDMFGRFFPQPAPGIPPTFTPDPNRYYPVGGIKLSPSGERLAVFDSMTMRVWDLATGKLEMLTSMPGISQYYSGPPPPGIPAPQVSWSADGRLLATFARNFGGSVWLIDPQTGGHLRMLAPYADNMVWSPAADMVALHVNTSAEIWDSKPGAAATESLTSHPTP